MAFQTGTTAASDARRDLLTDFVAMATSKHISAAAINSGGTGYTVGDILTITHAGAWHDCKLEVLTVSAGVITAVKILDNGAFSNRVATVAINAAGTGYAAGDIVRLTTGTFTEFCKVKVDTVSGSAAATVSVYETGGAYSAIPTATGGATDNSIGTGSGTGLTIDTTMTGLIGTTAISATGGTGSTATFDLTLTDTGWSAEAAKQNQNNYSYNSITDEKEVFLKGTVAGGDEPYIGIRTYTYTSGIDTYYGWLLRMSDAYNSSLAFTAQQNFYPTGGDPLASNDCALLVFDDDQDYWMRMDGRHAQVVVKCVGGSSTSYNHAMLGLLDPYGTTTESPYAAYLSGCTGNAFQAADVGGSTITGPTECVSTGSSTDAQYVRFPDSNWWGIRNTTGTGSQQVNCVSPLGITTEASGLDDLGYRFAQFDISMDANIFSRENIGNPATAKIMPTLGDNEVLLFPCSVISTSNGANDITNQATNNAYTLPRGDLPGIFWCPATDAAGTALVAEDVIDVANQDYILFQNAHRTERYSYFALKRN